MTPLALVALTELGASTYHGEDGGLYGAGRNAPPTGLAARAGKAATAVQPLDRDGKPSPDGRIVLLSLGMSNGTEEWRAFMELAGKDRSVSPRVLLVDGAQGGMDVRAWAKGNSPAWKAAGERLAAAGASPLQVQAVWCKHARARPAESGAFPVHARELAICLEETVTQARRAFPNLKLMFFSSRTYAGFATTPLNPEPYAYESAFAVRWMISAQRGEPVLLWGPYLWGGAISWERSDFGDDGTHPSESGRLKVARALLAFFTTDPAARIWFAPSR